jgi:hypothetical protein
MSMSLHSAAVGFTTPPTLRHDAEQIQHLPTPCTSSSWHPSDILIDGSISYMFGPDFAEVYFSYLFKGSIRRSLLCWDVPDWPGACFTSQGILSTAAESFMCLEREPKPHLLDYDARNLEGTVVPQVLWSPRSLGATNKYVLDATLQFPIFFVRQDRTVGISLQEAVEGPRGDLLGAQSYAPLGGQSTLHVRIQVSGYCMISCPYSLFGQRGTVTSPGRVRRGLFLTRFVVYHSGLIIERGSVKYRHGTTRAGGTPSPLQSSPNMSVVVLVNFCRCAQNPRPFYGHII